MKKNLLTLITVLVAIVVGTGTSNAHNFEVDGIYYNIIDETSVEVTYCDENKDGQVDDDKEYVGKVVIPATVNYNDKSYSVKGIFDFAFFNSTELTSLILPEGVIYIGLCAFNNTAIESIVLPSTLETISSSAFYDCTSLKSITIPASVETIAETVFGNCYRLESIVVEAGNAKYDSRNNCNAIIETASNTLVVGCRNTNIPATVQKIGNEAFWGIYWDFDQPVEISIPEGVTEIGYAAFSECTSIQKISLPSTLEKIGTEAFSNCVVLTEIICCNDNPPTIEKGTAYDEYGNGKEVFNTFDCVPENAILIVPVGSAEKYAKAEGWDRFNGYINEDDTLTGVESVIIDENAPIEYYNLQGVKLARPENGIFIKKQGSKATKVIINN